MKVLAPHPGGRCIASVAPFIRLRQNTPWLPAPSTDYCRTRATGMNGGANHAEAWQSEGGLASAKFRKDSTCVAKATPAEQVAPRLAAWSFIISLFVLALSGGQGSAGTQNEGRAIRLVNGSIAASSGTIDPQTGALAAKLAPDLAGHLASAPAGESLALVVQFDGRIRQGWRRAIEAAGARVVNYLPDDALLVQAPAGRVLDLADLGPVRWIGRLPAEYKIAPGLLRAHDDATPSRPVPLGPMSPEIAARDMAGGLAAGASDGRLTLVLRTLSPGDNDAVSAVIARQGGITLETVKGRRQGTLRIKLPAEAIPALAGLPQVEWIELFRRPLILNNVAAEAPRMDVDIVHTNFGLTGRGQVVAICDTGLDTGNANTLHPDFTNRLRAAYGLARPGDWSDLMGHGTHCAGSVLGNGSAWSNGLFHGIAYEAELVMQSAGDAGNSIYLPADLNDLYGQTYTNEARIHSDSWGEASAGTYSISCQQTDEFVWDHPDFLPVFAAGNDGQDRDGDGVVDLGAIGEPASSKNVLTVGAACTLRLPGSGGLSTLTWGGGWAAKFGMPPICDALVSSPWDGVHQGMAAFSSRGPCIDGRSKPDIVAPGTDIVSCRSRMPGASKLWGTGDGVLANGASNYYTFSGGTSMATPLTAGAAALVRQYLVEIRGIAQPGAALIKALMVAGARSLAPGQYGAGRTREIPFGLRPNPVEGWGHVTLGATLFPGGSRTNLLVEGSLTNDGAFTLTFTPTASNHVAIVLAWSDYPASPLAAAALVNDLDLLVITPGGRMLYPNGLSAPDRINNVEGLDIDPSESGAYTILVQPANLPYAPQPFALVVHEGAPRAATLDKLWHDPAPVTSAAPVHVKAAFTTGASGIQSAQTAFRVNGGAWAIAAMSPEGAAVDRAVFSAAIPVLAAGSRVEYFVAAATAWGAEIVSGTNAFTVWNNAIYVSPAGAEQLPYDTPAKGLRNIQAALDVADEGLLILVEPGCYAAPMLVITQAVNLRSTAGAAVTILDGENVRPCLSNNSSALISGFTITRGYAGAGAPAGGAYLHGGDLRDCRIVGNAALTGAGGVAIETSGRLNGCDFMFNAGAAGGALATRGGGDIGDCRFYCNAASSMGGAMALVYGGSVSNCVIMFNAAMTNGGGVMIMNMFNMYPTRLVNCLIANNAAAVEAGGVQIGLGATLENCTIAYNAAPSAGGLQIGVLGLVSNTIIYGNSVSNVDCIAPFAQSTIRLLNCCFTPEYSGTNITVSRQVAADPLFRNPQAGDYRLCADSPCRDAGTNAGWMVTAADLAGGPRIINHTVDIGAYELALPKDMWNFAAVRNAFADYDGDGCMDAAVYGPAAGFWQMRLSSESQKLYSILFGGADYVAVSGDYDGNRAAEMALYQPSSGLWLWQGADGRYIWLGGPNALPVPGDYDGDGKTDPAVYDAGAARWTALLSGSAYARADAAFGLDGGVPVFGDYDGDGKTDPALYAQTSGIWSAWLSGDGYRLASAVLGGEEQIPAAADYDGDGRCDPAVYQPATWCWTVALSNRGYEPIGFYYGGAGFSPVPADYDGDGKADPAVYCQTDGLWYAALSGQRYVTVSCALGGPGYIAVAAGR